MQINCIVDEMIHDCPNYNLTCLGGKMSSFRVESTPPEDSFVIEEGGILSGES